MSLRDRQSGFLNGQQIGYQPPDLKSALTITNLLLWLIIASRKRHHKSTLDRTLDSRQGRVDPIHLTHVIFRSFKSTAQRCLTSSRLPSRWGWPTGPSPAGSTGSTTRWRGWRCPTRPSSTRLSRDPKLSSAATHSLRWTHVLIVHSMLCAWPFLSTYLICQNIKKRQMSAAASGVMGRKDIFYSGSLYNIPEFKWAGSKIWFLILTLNHAQGQPAHLQTVDEKDCHRDWAT